MRGSAALLVLIASLTLVGASSAQTVHAIDLTKTCTSPVKIGDPYTCTVTATNTLDTAQDTLVVTALSDTVHAAGGDQPSGNILGSVGLVFGGTGSVSCLGGSGSGTNASPYVGATSCSLAFGGTLTTTSFTHYTVQAADYGLSNHTLTDTASVTWHNTCTSPGDNCSTGDQTKTAGGSALVQQLQSSTSTTIHNAAHQGVTTVAVGAMVHDFVTVMGQPGSPVPTGNVVIEWFTNGSCTAPAAASVTLGPLDASGKIDGVSFSQPAIWAHSAFQATYLGDATYVGAVGGCESLTVEGGTAVQVAFLRAVAKKAGVRVRWRMGSEAGVLGYNVYRERRGVHVRVNRAIIRARGTIAGRSYSYLDPSVRSKGSLRYWLQVVGVDGASTWKVTRTS